MVGKHFNRCVSFRTSVKGGINDYFKFLSANASSELGWITTISAEPLDLLRQFIAGLSAIEHCHIISALKERLNYERSEIAGSADD
jgi:hypothetical protein